MSPALGNEAFPMADAPPAALAVLGRWMSSGGVVRSISLVAVAATLLLGSCARWPRLTKDSRAAEQVMSRPRIRDHVESGRAATDPERLPFYYQRGYALTPDGITDKAPSATVLASIEVGRRRPDHAGAIRELLGLAAERGADALTEVGYTLWIEDLYHGGVLIRGWIYHGLAVVWEDG